MRLTDRVMKKIMILDCICDSYYAGNIGFPSPSKLNTFDLVSLVASSLYMYIFQLLFPIFL